MRSNGTGQGGVQRTYQRAETTLRMRRPPEEYVTLLSQSEQEFRTFVQSFEKHPLFDKLVSEGTLARVRLRGRVPREKYEEFMDAQLLEFLERYGITAHEGWERDFLSPQAMNRVAELSAKYGVPAGPLVRQLRYLRSSTHGAPQNWSAAGDLHRLAAPAPAMNEMSSLDNVASGSPMVDLTEIIETTREFVQRYEVSEQDFLDSILNGEATAEELAERFGCSLREAEEVLEAADRIYLVESYEASGTAEAPRKNSGTRSSNRIEEPVAFVQVAEGKLSIQFHHDSVYAQRYQIQPGLMKAARAEEKKASDKSENLPSAARELLLRARLINQRLSALSRLITTLCQQQLEFLETGDMRRLKPLAQAELARQLGEHPSTVSRLIRGKSIETPWGKFPLLYLCQSKTDVVARLIAQFPKLTDQEVVLRLREEYDCQIARRTVAYHRGKRLRRNKRHKTAGQKAEPEARGVQAAQGAGG